MKNKQARALLDKYQAGTATPEELVLIKRAYNAEIPDDVKDIPEERYQQMKDTIWNRLEAANATSTKSLRLWTKIAAAAVLLLIAGTAAWFFTAKNSLPTSQTVSIYKNDVPAGGNKAILTLADGRKIVLTGAKNGDLANENNTVIHKTADGQISYSGRSVSNRPAFNTMTTPNGGQYSLTLSDGTKITLNAATTLKYPATFSGSSRIVELTGEAFFQVAKDKTHPFIVKTVKQEVKVLGTHFNINAYSGEPATKTTLIEGSVQLSALNTVKILKPGEQAELTAQTIEVTQVDTEAAMGWKNGDFIFNEDIKTIMRQISRWYDVEVIYVGKISDKEFLGTVSRSKNISEVLRALELTKRVHFKVEGRRITVMP